ncbi:MAG: hypothetical protein ACXVYV_09940 [Gaiellales bacterium]
MATVAAVAVLVAGGAAWASDRGGGPQQVGSAPWSQTGNGSIRARLRGLLLGHLAHADAVLEIGGTVHRLRIDAGRIVATGNGSITMQERDGSTVQVPLDASTRVYLDGRPSSQPTLRSGLDAFTVRDGNGPARAVRAFALRPGL